MPQFPLLENETKCALNKGNLLGASLVDSVNAWSLVVNAGCPDNPMGAQKGFCRAFFPWVVPGKRERERGNCSQDADSLERLSRVSMLRYQNRA